MIKPREMRGEAAPENTRGQRYALLERFSRSAVRSRSWSRGWDVLRGAPLYASGVSSHHCENSTRFHEIGGTVPFSKRNRPKANFDYASAVIRAVSSPRRKLPRLNGGQEEDILSFLDSLSKPKDVKDCYIRYLVFSFLPRGYALKQHIQIDL